MGGAKRWVLVVEDDQVVRDALVGLLGDEDDLAAVGTGSGGDALRVLGALRVHGLVVDLAMPGTNGLDLIDRVRAHEETRGVPVVVVTALAPGAIARRAAATVYPVVGKPFDAAELLATVRGALDRSG